MKNFHITKDPAVEQVFQNYPDSVRKKIRNLRRLILETAGETEEVTQLEETLKWGEPSYLINNGSTIRIDWKKKTPDQYAIYFKCTSKLVPTFRKVFKDSLKFEGDRAIVFEMDHSIPEAELKNCIRAALTYHKVKQLPLLGM